MTRPLDPKSAPFVPSRPNSSGSDMNTQPVTVSSELSEANKSLCKALVLERTTNRELEDALEEQDWEKTLAEQQCQALLGLNISLSVTVQMLGDLVKYHMKDKSQTPWDKEVEMTNLLDDSTRQAGQVVEQVRGLSIEDAIQALTRHANKYNNFLSELVVQQRAMVKSYKAEQSDKEGSGRPGSGSASNRPDDDLLAKSNADRNEAAGNDASHNTPQPQDDQIYNFDLLHKTDGHQLDVSVQSLRRHFVSDSTEADSHPEPKLHTEQSTKLISLTPERELSLKSTSPIEATTLKPELSLKSTSPIEATTLKPELSLKSTSPIEATTLKPELLLKSTLPAGAITLKPIDMRLRDGRFCHPIICRYFKQGYCAAGDTCKYWHNDTPKESRPVCRYFAAGYCRYGDACAFPHEETPVLTSITNRPTNIAQDTNIGDEQDDKFETTQAASDSASHDSVIVPSPGQLGGRGPMRSSSAVDTSYDSPLRGAHAYQPKPEPQSPSDLTIQWYMSKTNPVFIDHTDVALARKQQNSMETLDSTFWAHPVRYIPDVAEMNVLRTVMIDCLPENTTYQDILYNLHGTGALESIQLTPAIPTATGYAQSARLVFVLELPAQNLATKAEREGFYVKGKKVRVWQVMQAKYPQNPQLSRDVFVERYTRVLLIGNIKEGIVGLLPYYLREQVKMGTVIEFSKAENGVPLVEFVSVKAAAAAKRVLEREEVFGEAVFDFEIDYCE